MILPAVSVACIDHDCGLEAVFDEHFAGLCDVSFVVVRSTFAAAQDDVAVGISGGGDGGGAAVHAHAEECLWLGCGFDRVDGGFEISESSVLKSEWHGEAAGHLAVGLGFGGARADGRPADEVCDVLRGDRV